MQYRWGGAMTGTPTDLTRIYRGFPAPKKLPPRPFLTIGAKATLAIRERRGVE